MRPPHLEELCNSLKGGFSLPRMPKNWPDWSFTLPLKSEGVSITHPKQYLQYMSSVQNPGWLGYIGDEILRSYCIFRDYFISHDKEPVINQPVFHGSCHSRVERCRCSHRSCECCISWNPRPRPWILIFHRIFLKIISRKIPISRVLF